MTHPIVNAIFHRQVAGDDALLELAQARFREAGLGPEYYPVSVEALRHERQFHPDPAAPYTVHLPRDIAVMDADGQSRICAFAAELAGDPRAIGMVVHDQPEAADRLDE